MGDCNFGVINIRVWVQEKMNTSTDVLTDILSVVADGNGEIEWPPRNPEKTEDLRKVTTLEGF